VDGPVDVALSTTSPWLSRSSSASDSSTYALNASIKDVCILFKKASKLAGSEVGSNVDSAGGRSEPSPSERREAFLLLAIACRMYSRKTSSTPRFAAAFPASSVPRVSVEERPEALRRFRKASNAARGPLALFCGIWEPVRASFEELAWLP
jgi:hypothetical protein